MNNTAFKDIPTEDRKLIQRIERLKLFTNKYGVTKPFNASNDIAITSTTSSGLTSSSVFAKVDYINRDDDGVTYLATMRGDESSYANATGSGIVYHSFTSRVQNTTGSYVISDGINSPSDTSKIDIISISREFYYDKLDSSFFSVHLHTGSATTSSVVTEFKLNNGTIGLYPSATKFISNLGDKHFLYPVAGAFSSATTLYNKTTDEMIMLTDANLDKTKPFGEFYPDCGVVVLFVDKLKAEYTDMVDSSATLYMGAVVGRSIVQYNSMVIFARATASEFNHSNNPTFYEDYTNGVIKEEFQGSPTVFVTQIGLYNDNNNAPELIGIGTFSRPIEKNPLQELTIRAELSY